jgi:hypothetical protein
MKKIWVTLMWCFSISALACPNALPTDDVNFCASFKTAASCYCSDQGVPFGMCQDMHVLYNRMMVVFKTIDRACEFQHYTSKQNCIDNWRCYLAGGTDSTGRSCGATQLPCE